MTDVMHELCADLAAEHLDLDHLVAPLADAAWDMPTPAAGWTVRDQVSHLWFFDQRAVMAVTDPDAFAADLDQILASGGTDASVEPGRVLVPSSLLASWRDARAALLGVLSVLDPKVRIRWYGPPMGAVSFASARLMETWAHGQDVADALGVERGPTDRLRHVAHLGVRARPFSYAIRGLAQPEAEPRVELVGPGGATWTWGPEGGPDVVRGPALAFCLVVTQRRHVADVDLVVEGPGATGWIAIAQAFAGPPGPGRPPAPPVHPWPHSAPG